MDARLNQIIVGLPRSNSMGQKSQTYIAKKMDDVAITNNFEWKDGRALFDFTTRKLRLVQDEGSMFM